MCGGKGARRGVWGPSAAGLQSCNHALLPTTAPSGGVCAHAAADGGGLLSRHAGAAAAGGWGEVGATGPAYSTLGWAQACGCAPACLATPLGHNRAAGFPLASTPPAQRPPHVQPLLRRPQVNWANVVCTTATRGRKVPDVIAAIQDAGEATWPLAPSSPSILPLPPPHNLAQRRSFSLTPLPRTHCTPHTLTTAPPGTHHRKRVITSTLNMVVREAVSWKAPPSLRGSRKQGRVYYATQVRVHT